MVIGQLRLLEFTMLVIIAAVVNGIAADRGLETFLKVFSGGVLGAALCVFLLQAGDCYQLPTLRTPLKMFARIQGAVCLSFVGIACFLLVFFRKRCSPGRPSPSGMQRARSRFSPVG